MNNFNADFEVTNAFLSFLKKIERETNLNDLSILLEHTALRSRFDALVFFDDHEWVTEIKAKYIDEDQAKRYLDFKREELIQGGILEHKDIDYSFVFFFGSSEKKEINKDILKSINNRNIHSSLYANRKSNTTMFVKLESSQIAPLEVQQLLNKGTDMKYYKYLPFQFDESFLKNKNERKKIKSFLTVKLLEYIQRFHHEIEWIKFYNFLQQNWHFNFSNKIEKPLRKYYNGIIQSFVNNNLVVRDPDNYGKVIVSDYQELLSKMRRGSKVLKNISDDSGQLALRFA